MKTPRPIILALLLIAQFTASAQIQWYQNQDGNNAPPFGTVATTAQPFTGNSFVACYLWSSDNELNTWKISRSNNNGTETSSFFTSGVSSMVEFRIGKGNSVYVFERSFTPEYSPVFTVYKLNASLELVSQRNIEFPNGYFIYNVNAFEIDKLGNLYFAGDGQYPNAGGTYSPASFVLKTNKNLQNTWQRMDSSETSFSRLHIDRVGRVLIIQDYYSFFPEVRIKRYAENGQIMTPFSVQTDVNRFMLYSALDNDDNILLYGSQTVGDASQAMFLKRVSRVNGHVAYSKVHFTAASSQLHDLRVDDNGKIYTLVTKYLETGEQTSNISQINLSNGNIAWNRSINFEQDSCNLTRLVIGSRDQFYAVGERRSGNFYSKGMAVRMKKNGQFVGNFSAPDSVAFQRSHWLADGLIDDNNELIAIGNTSDFDSMTYSNNYYRSFAIKLGENKCPKDEAVSVMATAVTARGEVTEEAAVKITAYPNPAQQHLIVSNVDPAEYDRMTVFTLQGVQVRQQSINGTTSKIDISRLPDGVYMLVLNSSIGSRPKTMNFMVKK